MKSVSTRNVCLFFRRRALFEHESQADRIAPLIKSLVPTGESDAFQADLRNARRVRPFLITVDELCEHQSFPLLYSKRARASAPFEYR